MRQIKSKVPKIETAPSRVDTESNPRKDKVKLLSFQVVCCLLVLLGVLAQATFPSSPELKKWATGTVASDKSKNKNSKNQHLAATQETKNAVNISGVPGNGTLWERLSRGLLVEEYPQSGCLRHCGCPRSNQDCQQKYALSDIVSSAQARLSDFDQEELQTYFQQRHTDARASCSNNRKTTESGGWCLSNNGPRNTSLTFPNGDTIVTTDYLSAPSRIVKETVALLRDDNAQSLTELGSGVGQLLVGIVPQMPQGSFQYHAFDGAGNVEEVSLGHVKWIDLTLPIDVHKSDWVISLEVGEHVPTRYEGMVIRNIHRHNCRGVILSWAKLGQGGLQHVNNHSNKYLIDIFTKLGYVHDLKWQERLRNPDGNRIWFQSTIMVFRREKPVC